MKQVTDFLLCGLLVIGLSSCPIGVNSPHSAENNPADTSTGGALIEVLSGTVPIENGTGIVDMGVGYRDEIQPSQVFTIRNTGTKPLLLSDSWTMELIGEGEIPFALVQPSSTYLLPGETTTFTVTFNPDRFGSRQALLTIPSNSSTNPDFTFQVAGVAPPLKVYFSDWNGGWIFVPPEGTVDYTQLDLPAEAFSFYAGAGDEGEHTSEQLPFRIENLSTAGIDLDTPVGSGQNEAEISPVEYPPALAAEGTVDFTLLYTFPSYTEGSKEATISLPTSSDLALYPFTLQFHTDAEKELSLEYENDGWLFLGYGQTVTFYTYGSPVTQQFRVTNENIGRLTITGIELTGADPERFTLQDLPPFPAILKDDQELFSILFEEDTYYTADLEIYSDDPGLNPFVIHLEGQYS